MSFQLKTSMTCAMSAIFFTCATPALASTSPVTVTAPSEDDRSTRRVGYGDLDLTNARDQKRLDRRVDGAIKNVCGQREYHAVRTITARAPYQACSNEARTRARAAMNAAIALAHSGLGTGVKIADRAITVWARTED